MDINTTSLINNLHSSQAGSVQASAQLLVLKQAMNLQGQGAMALLASVQPPLATSGNLGTQLNVYA
ncbi:YjfB family protein [Paucibacter sp. O1-1]|uniref:putative motility protein n=1 Tax=unclassified Roseateles TaxID=2626991 RepID=UPI0010F75378|nr:MULTISPECIES: YjfB family protein [unclassified Roseateles]MCU7371299.1 YjfB family protein [Paucibacter sp. O1-1]MCZ7883161.1 YjfB family protein [Paucibacter sp. M5-1]MDA3826288.1 YjfB family protein [Paucibacter sp. O1-1]MDC6168008.1 YjfB family protein [Paucibacter sp. XJ19-41]